MRKFLVILLGVVLLATATVYFGGGWLYPLKDSHEELLRMADANGKALVAQRQRERAAGVDSEEVVSPQPKLSLNSSKAIGDALQEFRVQTRAGDFAAAKEQIEAVVDAMPDELEYQLSLADTLFCNGECEASVAAYDRAIELRPDIEPELWQRGLAQYYAGKFADGVKQFEVHQRVNSQDVENSVWHVLCEANVSDLKTAREKMIDIQADSRVPMREVFEMFGGRMTPAEVIRVAESEQGVVANSRSHRLHRYYGYLYVGLYQELLGDRRASLELMKKAAEICPFPRGNFMGEVARVHLLVRTQNR